MAVPAGTTFLFRSVDVVRWISELCRWMRSRSFELGVCPVTADDLGGVAAASI